MKKIVLFFAIAVTLFLSACSSKEENAPYYIKYEFENDKISLVGGAVIYRVDISCTTPEGIVEHKSVTPTYSLTYGPFFKPQELSATLSRGESSYRHKCRILLSHHNGPFAIKAESEGTPSISLKYQVTLNDLK